MVHLYCLPALLYESYLLLTKLTAVPRSESSRRFLALQNLQCFYVKPVFVSHSRNAVPPSVANFLRSRQTQGVPFCGLTFTVNRQHSKQQRTMLPMELLLESFL